jgi:hypothetical protein
LLPEWKRSEGVACGGEVLRLMNMITGRGLGGVIVAEEKRDGFFAAKPSCTASRLADECP